jgi:hypothetical protein
MYLNIFFLFYIYITVLRNAKQYRQAKSIRIFAFFTKAINDEPGDVSVEVVRNHKYNSP